MMMSAVTRTCMRDCIRDTLVKRILDGTYPPGMQLKELPLAREFNVSQGPIREALRELEGTGLVTCERYRGTHVRGTDIDEMRSSYELRAMIEARSIQRAAPLSESTLQLLERHIDDLVAAARRNDASSYLEAALRFHRALVEAGGNTTFLKTWDALAWDVRSRIIVERRVSRGEDLLRFLDMYRELITHLRSGEVGAAIALIENFLSRAAEVLNPA